MSRDKGIRLHPKYGLNPTISACIICGKDKNEIVLLGAACKQEAPMKMVTSLEPCDGCREKYLKEGVLLVETEGPGKAPTGTLSVIKVEAFQKIFNTPVPAGHIAQVEIGVLQQIGAVAK